MSEPPRLGFLICARNEASIIAATLENLRAAQPPPDVLMVLADHCTDATAELAEASGALVFRRDTGLAENKGLALRWLFEQWPPVLAQCQAIVIVDADSRIAPDFVAAMREAVLTGVRVGQCFVQPADLTDAPSAQLSAYSDSLTQAIEARFNQWWGWPVRLRGMGMLFEPQLLGELLPRVHTRSAEDIELGLLAVERGHKIHFIPQAVLYDPKPPDARRATRQRARWVTGLFQVWRDYAALIGRLALRGPHLWWWLQTMLVRPATLLVAFKVMVFALALLLPAPAWLRIILGLWICADMLYYLGGLWLMPTTERGIYWQALRRAPIYFWVWCSSVWLAWRERKRQRWLSVRDD